MKPKIIFKTTAGVFGTEPKWFLYIMPVNCEPDWLKVGMHHSALLGIKQPLPKRYAFISPAIPFVSCETD